MSFEIASSLEDDGWNSLGKHTYDPARDDIVECSTNCAPYSDTTGYYPRNHPVKKFSKASKKKNQDKYTVNGKDKLWQPLVETNNVGNFARQDHVTPHIGNKAKPLLLSEFKKAEKPEYNYKSEAELVVKRLKELVGDEERIEMLRFFDNKLYVRTLIQVTLETYFVKVLSFEDYVLFISGISSAEHDATLAAWREKVRFDRVRPTTVIQRWNDDVINTYHGNPLAKEPQDIKARDFQSFIRVMPHSEHPSGSAAICTAYADFTDLFTKEYFGGTMGPLLPIGGPDGIVGGCGTDSPFQIGCGQRFQLNDMADLAALCGESRLWGGMHFTKAVEAGNDIVTGIGELAMEFVKTIKNGSNWTNQYMRGDKRPVCGE